MYALYKTNNLDDSIVFGLTYVRRGEDNHRGKDDEKIVAKNRSHGVGYRVPG